MDTKAIPLTACLLISDILAAAKLIVERLRDNLPDHVKLNSPSRIPAGIKATCCYAEIEHLSPQAAEKATASATITIAETYNASATGKVLLGT